MEYRLKIVKNTKNGVIAPHKSHSTAATTTFGRTQTSYRPSYIIFFLGSLLYNMLSRGIRPPEGQYHATAYIIENEFFHIFKFRKKRTKNKFNFLLLYYQFFY